MEPEATLEGHARTTEEQGSRSRRLHALRLRPRELAALLAAMGMTWGACTAQAAQRKLPAVTACMADADINTYWAFMPTPPHDQRTSFLEGRVERSASGLKIVDSSDDGTGVRCQVPTYRSHNQVASVVAHVDAAPNNGIDSYAKACAMQWQGNDYDCGAHEFFPQSGHASLTLSTPTPWNYQSRYAMVTIVAAEGDRIRGLTYDY